MIAYDWKALPGAAELNPAALSALSDLIDRDGALERPEDAIRALCVLKSLVAHSGVTSFPDTPADCFCAEGPFSRPDRRDEFRASGDELRFIARSTLDALFAACTTSAT